jgi:hypothetical protein
LILGNTVTGGRSHGLDRGIGNLSGLALPFAICHTLSSSLSLAFLLRHLIQHDIDIFRTDVDGIFLVLAGEISRLSRDWIAVFV